jgi:hypothetical protein
MGTAHTSPVPDYCPNCARDTPTSIDLNRGGQFVGQCAVCKVPKGNGAIEVAFTDPKGRSVRTSRSIVGTGAKVGGDQDERELPAMVKPTQELPQAKVLPFPQQAAHGARQAAAAPSGPQSAEQIVEGARATPAQLDAESPALEAELARAKLHRKGLAKMVAAYDGVAPRRSAAPAIADPGPPSPAPAADPVLTQMPAGTMLLVAPPPADVEITYTDGAPEPEATKPARKRVAGRFARRAAP